MWRRGQWEHSSMWPWPSAHRRTHRRTDRTQEPWTFLNVLKQLVSSSCPGVSGPGACFLVTIPESCLEKSCLIEFRVHMLKKNTKYWLCHNCANTDLPYVLYFHVCLHIKAAVCHAAVLLCCCAMGRDSSTCETQMHLKLIMEDLLCWAGSDETLHVALWRVDDELFGCAQLCFICIYCGWCNNYTLLQDHLKTKLVVGLR